MVFKIKTSKRTMEIFSEIEASENLPPYITAKLSISLSLKLGTPLTNKELSTDTSGLELNRQTITGEYDELFKCLISMDINKHVNDDDYFQKFIKAHIDRGARMLYSEFKYGGDLITQLLKNDKGI